MKRANGIHIFGASGSGVSTLGWHLGQALNVPYLDADNFYWMATDPPFTTKVPADERLRNLVNTVDPLDDWILGGSVCGWGDALIPRFDTAVFVYLPPAVRLARLQEREATRHGDRIKPGGDMHAQHVAFMEWARGYDNDAHDGRSLALHRTWARKLTCPIIELRGPNPVEAMLGEVLAAL